MSAGVCEPPKQRSLYRKCYQEVLEHKWNTSKTAGYDRGEAAVSEWVRFYWTTFLRARWVEHLQGQEFWSELHLCDFGLLKRKFHDRQPLLNSILDQLKAGKENLDVLRWAWDRGMSIEPVIEILEALDVNSSRLQHAFDPSPE